MSLYGNGAYDPVKTPFELDEADFPRPASLEEQLTFLLRYAILAPSTHNTQPWKFAIREGGVEIYADYARRMPAVDPGQRELLMSVGAAIFNLRVAAAHFGLGCVVMYRPNGGSDVPVAVAAVSAEPESPTVERDLKGLFPFIARRRTNRSPFLLSRIPHALLRALRDIPHGGRASLAVSTDGKLNEEVAQLVAEGDRIQFGDSSFRKDLSAWLRPGWSEKPDGIPASSLGAKGVTTALAPWAARVLNLGQVRSASDRNLCIESPGLLVIQSEDAVPHLLESGELLERVLLTIAKEGLQVSYFNMPIHVPDLRFRLRSLLGLSAWPQLLVRVGYCLTEPPPTPRRPVEEMILEPSHA